MGDQHSAGHTRQVRILCTRQDITCRPPALPLALLPMLGALHSPARCPCASLCKENTPFSHTCVSQYSPSIPIASFSFQLCQSWEAQGTSIYPAATPGGEHEPAGDAPAPTPDWFISRSQAGSKTMGAVSTSPGPPRPPFSVSHQD